MGKRNVKDAQCKNTINVSSHSAARKEFLEHRRRTSVRCVKLTHTERQNHRDFVFIKKRRQGFSINSDAVLIMANDLDLDMLLLRDGDTTRLLVARSSDEAFSSCLSPKGRRLNETMSWNKS